jgi:hypothetical protein
VKVAGLLNNMFNLSVCCCILRVFIVYVLAVVVSVLLRFVYCILLEFVLNSCNMCYLSVVSYCVTTATGLKPNCC